MEPFDIDIVLDQDRQPEQRQRAILPGGVQLPRLLRRGRIQLRHRVQPAIVFFDAPPVGPDELLGADPPVPQSLSELPGRAVMERDLRIPFKPYPGRLPFDASPGGLP